ncbi:GUCD1 [Bugula neritina]|uniref:GUCD1 n=1 Tax=Bugula neritina TaxID=10212 RepID=A0A7J7KGI6_BUGNE|nr:GUCD1 [Bugula neritina]
MDVQPLSVKHVQQQANWDCGLACVKMVLKSLNKDLDLMPKYIEDIRLYHSVYTIDLAYILSKYGFQCTLYTLSCEVDTGHAALPFYKSSFRNDKERIDNLFIEALQFGISCIQEHLTIARVSELLEVGGCLLIALVDWNLMSCTCCHDVMQTCSSVCSRLCFIFGSYQGHFILVTKINLANDEVVFHNPSRSSGPCYCSIQTFDRGRLARGTDEDLLLVKFSL